MYWRNVHFKMATLIALLAAALLTLMPASSSRTLFAQGGGPGRHPTVAGRDLPVSAGNLSTGARLSEAQQHALKEKHLAGRERAAEMAANDPQADAAGAESNSNPETDVSGDATTEGGSSEFHGTPGSFIIGANLRNSIALSKSSLTAETAAINEGPTVFYTGNWYASLSSNGGSTWTDIAIPTGPADAPNFCCDQDLAYDQARGVTFWSMLYLNKTGTNGVIRIFVKRTVSGAPSCSYTWDVAGTNNNIVPDYPHLGLTNDYLYVTANNLTNGNSWTNSQVKRYNLDEMSDCAGVSTNTFTYTGSVGQRVFVPVEGARETMYWGMNESSTSFRIFRWPEASTSPSSFLRTVAASTFANPDCRGGTGNFDFIERSTSWRITGFRMRGAVGANRLSFFWHSANDANHVQAYIRAAVFTESTLALASQPDIWNADHCFGYPAVSTNERGNLGISLAYGGKKGGGGAAAQGAVGIDDDYTSGYSFELIATAGGTHNQTDGRFGDYFTINPHEPCDLFFAATNYALLNGNSSASHVNARYVEFGRGRDNKCYTGWKTRTRVP